MKSTLTAFIVGALVTLAMADPIRFGGAQRNPAGTCPPKDGELPVYLPDTEDCTVFYECSGGVPFPKECQPNLCFDPTLNVCAFPDEPLARTPVGNCPPRDGNETLILVDNKNCSIYYICSNGNAISQECLPGMAWNVELKTCDWAIDVECSAGVRPLELDIMPLTAVGTCPPRDTGNVTYLRDDKNCTVYYMCSNGQAIKQECLPGMAWNADLNTCDWAVDVKCNPASKGIQRSVVGECPVKDGAFPVYLPDSESCGLYYECSGGIPVQNNCPGNLEFSPSKNVCVDPLDSDCKATGTNPPPSNSTTPSVPPANTTVPSVLNL